MATIADVHDGLEGVLAFASEIAEPDRDGGTLRYRGVDIAELVGTLPFEAVWGLLVDGRPDRPLAPADPHPLTIRTGDTRVDVQSAIASLAPEWGIAPSVDVSPEVARDQLSRISATTLSFVAQSARGVGLPPVTQARIDQGRTLAERFLLRWRGETSPDAAAAIDAYWITAAEHGMNASTFAARIVASTGATSRRHSVRRVGALSGPLHGGAPARCCGCSTRSRPTATPTPTWRGRCRAETDHGLRRIASTGPRTRAPGCSARSPSACAHRGWTWHWRWSGLRSRHLPLTSPIACSQPTSSSGRR